MRTPGSVAVFVAALLVTAAPAHAAPTPLPLTAFGDVVVDDATGRVFVSAGPAAADPAAVAALDADGQIIGTVEGTAGAAGMVVDGPVVHVARCGHEEISAIDTTTLAVTGAIPAPGLGGDCDLALAGGRFWYVDAHGKLHSVALAPPNGHGWHPEWAYVDALFATASERPERLVVADQDGYAHVFDVVADAPALAAAGELGEIVRALDIALSPLGDIAYVASKYDSTGRAVGLPAFDGRRGYRTATRATAVSVSRNGERVAFASPLPVGQDVRIFEAGRSTALHGVEVAGEIPPGALAFAAGRYPLYAVTVSAEGGSPRLHVVRKPGKLAVAASTRTLALGDRTTLAVRLATRSAVREVRVFADPYGKARKLIRVARLGRDGRLRLRVRPGRLTDYSVIWKGDREHSATTAGVRVRVRAATGVKVSRHVDVTRRGYHLFRYSAGCWPYGIHCPTFTARVRPAHRGSSITFVMQQARGGRWVEAGRASFELDRRSRATAQWRYRGRAWIGVALRVRAVFGGDPDHLGDASRWRYLRITEPVPGGGAVPPRAAARPPASATATAVLVAARRP